MLRPDSKGRITLGQLAEGVSGYLLTETEDHKLVLEPYAEIPAREKWLFENPSALKELKSAIQEAKQGKLKSRGNFSQFLTDSGNAV
ncbi:MAG: hypothetical protein ACKOAD_07895 [Gammaproteobacteria bacterium]